MRTKQPTTPLGRIMRKHKISDAALQMASGISVWTIIRIRLGRTSNPNDGTCIALAAGLATLGVEVKAGDLRGSQAR